MRNTNSTKTRLTRILEIKHKVVYLGSTHKLSTLEIRQLQLDIFLGKIDHNDIKIKQMRGSNFGTSTPGDDYSPVVYINPNGSLTGRLRGFSAESELQFELIKATKERLDAEE